VAGPAALSIGVAVERAGALGGRVGVREQPPLEVIHGLRRPQTQCAR
jgi:hypothetical protein